MEEEDAERILESIERVYGSEIMEIGASNARFRQAVIRGYLYGTPEERQKKIDSGKRATFSWKQYEPLNEKWTENYSNEVNTQ